MMWMNLPLGNSMEGSIPGNLADEGDVGSFNSPYRNQLPHRKSDLRRRESVTLVRNPANSQWNA
jgi:hypothetical protein